MITECFEVRDRMTFLPVLAVQMLAGSDPHAKENNFVRALRGYGARQYLLYHCGYPNTPPYSVLLTKLNGTSGATADPYEWGDRTMRVAHLHVVENFDALEDGAVIDVEFLLGETQTPKRSEREETL